MINYKYTSNPTIVGLKEYPSIVKEYASLSEMYNDLKFKYIEYVSKGNFAVIEHSTWDKHDPSLEIKGYVQEIIK